MAQSKTNSSYVIMGDSFYGSIIYNDTSDTSDSSDCESKSSRKSSSICIVDNCSNPNVDGDKVCSHHIAKSLNSIKQH